MIGRAFGIGDVVFQAVDVFSDPAIALSNVRDSSSDARLTHRESYSPGVGPISRVATHLVADYC